MAKHENKTFKGERVALDGGEFHDCRFEDCTIVFTGEGAFPVLLAPKFVGCTFALEGAAQNTAEYLRLLFSTGGADLVASWLPEIFGRTAPDTLRFDG
jgi:hypothetical protein